MSTRTQGGKIIRLPRVPTLIECLVDTATVQGDGALDHEDQLPEV